MFSLNINKSLYSLQNDNLSKGESLGSRHGSGGLNLLVKNVLHQCFYRSTVQDA